MSEKIDIKYTQNFFQRKGILKKILSKSTNITKDDFVIEIGAGKGIITLELANSCKDVYSYELDKDLYGDLDRKINTSGVSNIKLRNQDFLKADLSKFPTFKVFSNIPFFLTSEIVRKLFLSKTKMKSAYLFMEKDAALRFIGLPQRKETLISLVLKLNWGIEIVYSFNRSDFYPVPATDVVLVQFLRKENQPINQIEFQDFLAFLFNARKANIKQTLLSFFSFTQVKIIKKNLDLNWEQSATDLSFQQWLTIYNIAKQYMPREKFLMIKESFLVLNKNKVKQTKDRGYKK